MLDSHPQPDGSGRPEHALRATPAKHRIYVVAFTVLGLLATTLLHALVETWYIGLLRDDFGQYGFGWGWDTWYMIHTVATVVLAVIGIAAGYVAGQYFWRVLYVEGRYRRFTRWLGP